MFSFLIVYNYRKGIGDQQEIKISEETGILTNKAFIKHCLAYKTVFNKSFICMVYPIPDKQLSCCITC